MKVLVNKKGNYPQLRLLFPTLQIARDGAPVYGPVVFSTYDYDVSEKTLFLLQSSAGIPLDTQTGLVAFMEKVSFMAPSKIQRFRSISSFGSRELVYAMYHEAKSLQFANRSYLEPDDFFVAVQDFLKLPYFAQVEAVYKMGPSKVLTRLLTTLDRFYSMDPTMKRPVYQALSETLIGFNRQNFKANYKLTGNDEVDCLTLLSYFPHYSSS